MSREYINNRVTIQHLGLASKAFLGLQRYLIHTLRLFNKSCAYFLSNPYDSDFYGCGVRRLSSVKTLSFFFIKIYYLESRQY